MNIEFKKQEDVDKKASAFAFFVLSLRPHNQTLEKDDEDEEETYPYMFNKPYSLARASELLEIDAPNLRSIMQQNDFKVKDFSIQGLERLRVIVENWKKGIKIVNGEEKYNYVYVSHHFGLTEDQAKMWLGEINFSTSRRYILDNRHIDFLERYMKWKENYKEVL